MQSMIEKQQCNPIFRGQYIASIFGAGYIAMDNTRGFMIIARFPTKERAKRFLDRIGECKEGELNV